MTLPLSSTVTGISKQLKKTKKMVSKTISTPSKTSAAPSVASTSSVPSPTEKLLNPDTKEEKAHEEIEAVDAEEEGEGNEQEQVQADKPFVYDATSTLPDITKNPLPDIATTAALLGALFGFGMTSALFATLCSAPLYLMALSAFHFLEFYITAKYNPTRVHSESFIINNGSAYTIAHTFALIETAVEYYFFPTWKLSYLPIKVVGIMLIFTGQYTRTLAMKTAGKSFNHLVQQRRANDHELVTEGIYSYFRHPSYFGFFWWAIGTQLLLLNPISLVGFAVVLYAFFKERIFHEEKFLRGFFGERYDSYSKKTRIYIPFL